MRNALSWPGPPSTCASLQPTMGNDDVDHRGPTRASPRSSPDRSRRPAEAPHAFVGLDRMFLAGATPDAPGEAPDAVCEVVRRAVDGGVQNVVVLSSHGPLFEIELPPERWHWLAVERAVEASCPAWTHLRPPAVMASMLVGGYPPTGSLWAGTIRRDRRVREPNGDAKYPFVDEDDPAAVAATVLFDSAFAGSIVEAIGPPISSGERVALIQQAIGEHVVFEGLSPDEASELWLRQGWPAETIRVTLWAQTQYLAQPLPPDSTIERILGRPPHTVAAWLSKHHSAFR